MITGAAGGIGLATTKLFLEKGANVVATDINIKKLTALGKNDKLKVVECDLSDDASIPGLHQAVSGAGFKIGTVISGAGIYETYPVSEAETEHFRKIMEVNFFAHQKLLRLFMKDLIATGGRFILISSESVKFPALFQPYMISKIALEAFAVTVRQEMALKGVRVIIVRPGAVNTGLLDWMKGTVSLEGHSLFRTEFYRSFRDSIKMTGKTATPEKVAKVILMASCSKRPRRVYNVNHNPALVLLSLIPSGAAERIIKKRLSDKK